MKSAAYILDESTIFAEPLLGSLREGVWKNLETLLRGHGLIFECIRPMEYCDAAGL